MFQIICCESTRGKELLPLTGIFDKSQLGQESEPREVSKEGQLEAVVTPGVEGWKNAVAPPTNLQIQNRLSALGAGEDKQDLSGDLSELTEPKPFVYTKGKRQVIVTGDSLLWEPRHQSGGLTQAGISGSLLSQS